MRNEYPLTEANVKTLKDLKQLTDHYEELLRMAAQFADENRECQAKYQGKVFDGMWLASHIEDVLNEKE